MPTTVLSSGDEQRLRELAHGVAKGIEDGEALLGRLGFTVEDYNVLSESYTFKEMLRQATAEWAGANNTQKRIKLKAAVNIEEGLPSMYRAMVNEKEPLAARVKVFEVLARMAGVGIAEPMAVAPGAMFRLEINLGKEGGGEDQRRIIIDAAASEQVTPGVTSPSGASSRSTVGPLLDAPSSCDELIGGMEGWEGD